MNTYQRDFTYNGTDVTIDIILNTGSVVTPGANGFEVSENTHSIRIIFGAEDVTVGGILKRDLLTRAAQMEADAKANIDGVNDAALNALLLEAGYELQGGLDTPDNFTAVPQSNIAIMFDWDPVTGADSYFVEFFTTPDYSSLYGAYGNTTDSPVTQSGFMPSTTYYCRLQAYSAADGYSNYAYASATTPA